MTTEAILAPVTSPDPVTSLLSPAEIAQLNATFESKGPQEIIAWAIDRFFPDITVACSFGGAGGMALLDMALKVRPDVDVFYLDTDFLFKETYDTLRRSIEQYGIAPSRAGATLSPEEQAADFGEALWERDPDLCCELRKVVPQKRYLSDKKVWVTGLRRDQGETRKDAPILAWNAKFGVLKLNPLANWTEKEIWSYILANSVPYNPLLDQGYRSIGCTNCTRPVAAEEAGRAGRWEGFEKTECGLHT